MVGVVGGIGAVGKVAPLRRHDYIWGIGTGTGIPGFQNF